MPIVHIVDAFTTGAEPFTGNPAGVCLLEGDDFPDEKWMGAVAAELNLSETAFAHQLSHDPAADWALRWFTPAVEVDLCGHATLATAHVMRETGAASGPVRFATRSGVLPATARADGTATLDFPANPPVPMIPPPDGLTEALGAQPEAVYGTGALGDLFVELLDEQAVRTLTPDQAALARVGCRGVIVTARAAANGSYDYVSRFFGPAVGIPEDPVTGSAHTALAPFWSARLGHDRLTGLQASARTGIVNTRLRGDRVELTGHAVTVLHGRLAV